ncbi:MAG: hypothetical protein HS115_18695 [Spirochaetales bacterium]|nr:hypothetical protein [Spirochaetales bacterium]
MHRLPCVLLLFLALNGPTMARELLLDVLLPGYGALSRERYVSGGLIAAGRLSSAYLAFDSYVEHQELKSRARAARLAELLYGPGRLFLDPVSGPVNARDLQKKADRRLAASRAFIAFHLGLSVGSLFYTAHLISEEKYTPTVELLSDGDFVNQGAGIRLGLFIPLEI